MQLMAARLLAQVDRLMLVELGLAHSCVDSPLKLRLQLELRLHSLVGEG